MNFGHGTLRTGVVALLLAAPAHAGVPARAFPEHCRVHLSQAGEEAGREARHAGDPERRWNAAYQAGFQAIRSGDHVAAERAMCRALDAARRFGERDWRFAETLDELGLIAFQFGELERAERMQGAAVAEMLLAVGPSGQPPDRLDTSAGAVVRSDCSSSVRVYVERLGWVLDELGDGRSVAALQQAPWRVFWAGYLPLDRDLGQRLDWLISRYLLQENLTAAAALTELQDEIDGR